MRVYETGCLSVIGISFFMRLCVAVRFLSRSSVSQSDADTTAGNGHMHQICHIGELGA